MTTGRRSAVPQQGKDAVGVDGTHDDRAKVSAVRHLRGDHE